MSRATNGNQSIDDETGKQRSPAVDLKHVTDLENGNQLKNGDSLNETTKSNSSSNVSLLLHRSAVSEMKSSVLTPGRETLP